MKGKLRRTVLRKGKNSFHLSEVVTAHALHNSLIHAEFFQLVNFRRLPKNSSSRQSYITCDAVDLRNGMNSRSHPSGEKLEIKFDGNATPPSKHCDLRQQDVKQTWFVV